MKVSHRAWCEDVQRIVHTNEEDQHWHSKGEPCKQGSPLVVLDKIDRKPA